MPFTPFHLGPGGLIQVLAPRRVSLLALGAANVVIDVEPLVFRLLHEHPRHRFMHTGPGAAVAIAATVLSLLLAGRIVRRMRRAGRLRAAWPGAGPIVVGATVGACLHLLLDGVMHADVHPWAPWSAANPLHGLVSDPMLHVFCLATGAIALALWLARARRGGTPPATPGRS